MHGKYDKQGGDVSVSLKMFARILVSTLEYLRYALEKYLFHEREHITYKHVKLVSIQLSKRNKVISCKNSLF